MGKRLPYALKPTSGETSEFRKDDSFVFSKDIKDWQTSKKVLIRNKANNKRLGKWSVKSVRKGK